MRKLVSNPFENKRLESIPEGKDFRRFVPPIGYFGDFNNLDLGFIEEFLLTLINSTPHKRPFILGNLFCGGGGLEHRTSQLPYEYLENLKVISGDINPFTKKYMDICQSESKFLEVSNSLPNLYRFFMDTSKKEPKDNTLRFYLNIPGIMKNDHEISIKIDVENDHSDRNYRAIYKYILNLFNQIMKGKKPEHIEFGKNIKCKLMLFLTSLAYENLLTVNLNGNWSASYTNRTLSKYRRLPNFGFTSQLLFKNDYNFEFIQGDFFEVFLKAWNQADKDVSRMLIILDPPYNSRYLNDLKDGELASGTLGNHYVLNRVAQLIEQYLLPNKIPFILKISIEKFSYFNHLPLLTRSTSNNRGKSKVYFWVIPKYLEEVVGSTQLFSNLTTVRDLETPSTLPKKTSNRRKRKRKISQTDLLPRKKLKLSPLEAEYLENVEKKFEQYTDMLLDYAKEVTQANPKLSLDYIRGKLSQVFGISCDNLSREGRKGLKAIIDEYTSA